MNRSDDWLKQAKRDYEKALLDYEHSFYEWACFASQQSAEKAVKALYYKLNRAVRGHSIVKMLDGLKELIDVSDEIYHRARILDRYYKESRYPNGFPEGSPYEFFDKKIAEEALNAAREIIGFCEDIISRL
ncbi:HEPN domain-containing protein [Dictyoglomus turgidum]|jgi:HEPN domain-containing protein|uniref:HEPN domain-containing protein n=1 Tax=Dictyoglomus TaxID=13 RepID=UPI000CCFB57B|nr:HEPN domain-containing protein [Dictyoglomus turgidum]PNV80647.1 MAG: DNA-binding protein [Dictyoglomus turgidum]